LSGGTESVTSLFEFLSVAIPIVVSFGVARLLDGANNAAKPGQLFLALASARPRLHLAIAMITLLTQILGFGAVWLLPGTLSAV
jgi:hypothetical protein